MALADEIEKLVRRKPGLTQMDLVRRLHDRAAQGINSACRRLVAEGMERREPRLAIAYDRPGDRPAKGLAPSLV